MMKEGWVRDRPEGARDQTTRHEKKRCEKETMSEAGGGEKERGLGHEDEKRAREEGLDDKMRCDVG